MLRPFYPLLILSVLVSNLPLVAQELHVPSFEEVISLSSASNPLISPDGNHVAFQVSQADWENNSFDTEIWMSQNGGTPFPFTHNPSGSSTSPAWSPAGEWLAYLSDKGNKNQIYVIRASGGESFPLTEASNGVQEFEWSPDGTRLLYTQSADRKQEEREKKYGGFSVEDAEYGKAELWMLPFQPDQLVRRPLPGDSTESVHQAKKLPIDSTRSISGFRWSPDGSKIGLTLVPNQNILSFAESDIYLYTLRDSSLAPLVKNPGPDQLIDWSPDGKAVLYSSTLGDTTTFFYKNGHLLRINTDGSENRELATDLDEQVDGGEWTESGIYALAFRKSLRKIIRINPESGRTEMLMAGPERVIDMSFSRDGKKIAFTAANDSDLTEVYLSSIPYSDKQIRKISSMSDQIAKWSTSESEMIEWKSEDGTMIEGVLHKPKNYDPARKYPLLVVIHGGPTGISVPSPVPSYVYPMVQWLNKGALILQPNYRGSAGYGEKFRSLNVRNLGVGDAWDVLSGVAHLEKEGLVDSNRVGVMGWSQGGYISAFLATTSDKFQAVSVGAGISNWMTYYVNTDIHPFTRQYLEGTPWNDQEIYEKTSPMTYINNASTPTLIQHGEFDQRVPVPNAYELYQGLQDVGVETKLIIYKGFGHGITKPKERLAATWHNWQWFGKYIWGEDIELPD